jgi:hypothetical protein
MAIQMTNPDADPRRDAARIELTNARLALNDWHDCASAEELNRWRAVQMRLITAAQASVSQEMEALEVKLREAEAARLALQRQIRELRAEMLRDEQFNPSETSPGYICALEKYGRRLTALLPPLPETEGS